MFIHSNCNSCRTICYPVVKYVPGGVITIMNLYRMSMNIGRIYGCHQRSDRSFHIHGRQFPVCARCTGVLIGDCLALVLFRSVTLPVEALLLCCLVMLLDWSIQHIGLKESNNCRRLITGCLCGYAFSTFFLRALILIKRTATIVKYSII